MTRASGPPDDDTPVTPSPNTRGTAPGIAPSVAPGVAPGVAEVPRRPGLPARVGGAVLGLVLAAAAVAAQYVAPAGRPGDGVPTFTGGVGGEVSAGGFSVRVGSVTAARSLTVRDAGGGERRIGTDHLFLVVRAAATVPKRPVRLEGLLRAGNGSQYDQTDKVSDLLTLRRAYVQPGWWTEGVLVFEVPRAALTGSKVIIGIPDDDSTPRAGIDLNLGRRAADDLAAEAGETYRLGES
ncbi:hypothetical protein Misp01_54830 [Microtetraspora sp. NBRC 13810]|uniref:hypothetical protein n=1 Tax=Microtetraspora sp. NBRC 13810 TaxID=3030990 RepID=UPI00249FD274|nr:hypothetical protein [Microtetraspora sp. NBRC 13810]GLW10355.1 hypothetical protein Misp01_54830 [Microtetraspora sp. NBRC 13810]